MSSVSSGESVVDAGDEEGGVGGASEGSGKLAL